MNEDVKLVREWGSTAVAGTFTATASGGVSPNVVLRGIKREDIIAGVKEHPLTTDIPHQYLAWIGRILAYWSVAEWIVTGTLCYLVGVGRKEGRHLFKGIQDRQEEVIPKIKYMLELKKTAVDYSELSKLYNKCAEYRNLLAHGIWVKHCDTKELCLQVTAGNWSDVGLTKKMYPEIILINDTKWFEQIFHDVEKAIEKARELDRKVEEMLPRAQ
jgi:hypothetical protein